MPFQDAWLHRKVIHIFFFFCVCFVRASNLSYLSPSISILCIFCTLCHSSRSLYLYLIPTTIFSSFSIFLSLLKMKNEQTNIYKSKNKLFSTIFYDSAEDAPHLTEWVRKMKGEREREKETDGEMCTLCESFLHTQKKK